MEEWSNAAEFEAIVSKAIQGRKVTTDGGVTSMAASPWTVTADSLLGMPIRNSQLVPDGTMYYSATSNQIVVSADTASQMRMTLHTEQKKESHVSNRNSKAFEVVTDEGTETVLAQSVVETEGRIKFLGYVEGHADYSGSGSDVVKSFRDEDVKTYRLVPKPEQDAKTVGKNTYKVNLTGGDSKTVQADHVLFQESSGDKPGRYSLVTQQGNGSSRTEYLVGESKVESIERIEADGTAATLVANDTQDAVSQDRVTR